MHFDLATLVPVLPEIVILTLACVVLVVDLYLKDEHRIVSYAITQFGLIVGAAVAIGVSGGGVEIVFDGSYVRDPMADVLKVAIYLVSLVAFLYAKDYLRQRGLFKGEFYTLGLFAVLGMSIMVSANSFLVVYLGLELLSLSLYALVAFNRDSKDGAEAAMKYFVLGAIASGMLLYGISMVYGATGTLRFDELAVALKGVEPNNIVLIFGLVFVVIGLAFKLGTVPFHYVGAGCLPGRAHRSDPVCWQCAQDRRLWSGDASAGGWHGRPQRHAGAAGRDAGLAGDAGHLGCALDGHR